MDDDRTLVDSPHPAKRRPGRRRLATTGLLALLALVGCRPAGTDAETWDEPDTAAYAEDTVTVDAPPESVLQFEGARPQNLLVISIDTLRRDRIGRYGRDTMPFLDGLLEEAVVLDDHRSCSNWTFASLICVQTGQTNVDLGLEPATEAHAEGEDLPGSEVPDDLVALPTWMQEAGFATSLVTTTRLLSDLSPTGNGFEEIAHEDDARARKVRLMATEAVQPLLAGEQPWFLRVHFRDPHFPYLAPEEYLDELDELEEWPFDLRTFASLEEVQEAWPTLTPEVQREVLDLIDILYDAEVRYLDDHLALFWSQLEELGALEETLVVFFTDHGEQFYDHGALQHYRDLFDEEAATLGAFWARGLTPTAYAGRTRHSDLVPGIFEALELPLPESVTGSVPGTLSSDEPRLTFFGPRGVVGGPVNTVDLGDLRLFYRWSGDLTLFDRAQDPLQLDDLYGTLDTTALEEALVAEVARSQEFVTWAEPLGLPE